MKGWKVLNNPMSVWEKSLRNLKKKNRKDFPPGEIFDLAVH